MELKIMQYRQMHRRSCRRGATMILVILLLPILFLLAAFAINIAYVELVRTELQITTDAACRAAGREFAISGSEADAIAVAQHVAERNQVAGIVIPLNAADLEFGASTRPDPVGVYQFEVSTRPNAVRITTNTLASGGIINIPPLLPIFGSFFPIKPIRSAVSTQVNLDVSLVIDRSGSMAYSMPRIRESIRSRLRPSRLAIWRS